MIIHQADRAVIDLFKKVWKVYNFMNKVGRLAEIPSMQALHGKIAQQTLGPSIQGEDFPGMSSRKTSATIQRCGNVLDGLMQQFRDRVIHDISVDLHRMAKNLDFSEMKYAADAGLDTSESKLCLPGTREDILFEGVASKVVAAPILMHWMRVAKQTLGKRSVVCLLAN
ncbi:hypothetical protein M405DRAFT_512078 [Rhizopogon salebrosus TDB-379]|nr:hypothetical protein M405DRAFT_512078 [Rhizopogon salebrosus TDB-379]